MALYAVEDPLARRMVYKLARIVGSPPFSSNSVTPRTVSVGKL
jgi:hypothetical protein